MKSVFSKFTNGLKPARETDRHGGACDLVEQGLSFIAIEQRAE